MGVLIGESGEAVAPRWQKYVESKLQPHAYIGVSESFGLFAWAEKMFFWQKKDLFLLVRYFQGHVLDMFFVHLLEREHVNSEVGVLYVC